MKSALWIGLACIWFPAQTLYAYSNTLDLRLDPSANNAGGGGGILFTGSPRQYGLSCKVCHVGDLSNTALRVSALANGAQTSLLEDGYVPGQLYELEVAFDGHDLGPEKGCGDKEDQPCNVNLFAMEILDHGGRPAGSFCPTIPYSDGQSTGCAACANKRAAGTWVSDDCSAILSDGFDTQGQMWRNGQRASSFFWRAPLQPSHTLTLYLSAVDGRGMEKEDGDETSYENDGVIDIILPLPMRGGEDVFANCQSIKPNATLQIIGLLFVWLFYRRPRWGKCLMAKSNLFRKTTPFLSVLLFVSFGVGCATVKPWERGVMADRCMALNPDPEEAALEEHLFAYREGSAGGFGGAGGGCGCN